MTPPREPMPWRDYFMNMANNVRQRSKDPRTQCGAVLVDQQNRFISSGFNGPPPAIPDMNVDWSAPNKYPWIIHAENNALWYGCEARGMMGLRGCTMFVTSIPCARCMLQMVRARLHEIIWSDHVKPVMCDDVDTKLAKEISQAGGVILTQYLNYGKEDNENSDRT